MSSMTIAQRLRSSIKMYADGYRVRGEWLTLREAERRTGLPYHVLLGRIEDGDLPAVHVLCVDSASIAEEIDDHLLSSTADLMTPEQADYLLGSRQERLARLGAVAS